MKEEHLKNESSTENNQSDEKLSTTEITSDTTNEAVEAAADDQELSSSAAATEAVNTNPEENSTPEAIEANSAESEMSSTENAPEVSDDTEAGTDLGKNSAAGDASEVAAVEPTASEATKISDDTVVSVSPENGDTPEDETEIDETDDLTDEDEDDENPERITEATFLKEEEDVSEFTKKDLVDLSSKLVDAIKKSNITASDVKNIDNVSKQIQVVFDEIITSEKATALQEYISENGSEEGFDFKNDNLTIRFETAMAEIRDTKHKFYKKLRQLKDDYFEVKTALLERLRLVVEEEEKGGSKENWNSFKKIQEDWRDAGNVNSPHNGSLWSAYNALIDRYFNIRNIQNELKDLDRKKNLEGKIELANKIVAISEEISNEGYSATLFKQANEAFEEYKALGPAPRDEQEQLWGKVKAAFDIIYDKKRQQNEANVQLRKEVLEVKSRLVESLKPFLAFDSGSINEWNAQTKEILAIQEQWNEIKGVMPREEGKTITKEFWSSIKQFFKNKSAFFDKLEEERKANLALKNAIIAEIEQMVAANTTDAPQTNRVIELQKEWRTIGHVPHKQKDSIYKKFKKVADEFFNLKRAGNAEQESEFEENLKAKQAICEEVEKLTEAGQIDLKKLADFKNEFNKIGFVPRKNIKSIQKRFIDAINNYVKASSNISSKEEEKLLIKNQIEVEIKGGGSRSLGKQENDLKKKAKALEDDIALWRNNIEFFGHSKGAEKMKAEFEKKIVKAEQELEALNQKVKLFSIALDS